MGVIRSPFVSGTVLNNPLAIGGTSLSATGLGGLAAVASPDIAKIILDPSGQYGNPECVYVTAHTAAATTATISRAAEGTTARAHVVGTPWIVGPTSLDFGWTNTPATPTAYNPLNEYITTQPWPGIETLSDFQIGAANRAVLMPTQPIASDCTISGILMSIGVQSGNVDVGVYMYDGTTFTRIVSLGSTACPAVSTPNFTTVFDITDTILYKGTRYFFALAADNNTATFRRGSTPFTNGPGWLKAASFPLPATITGASASTYAPIMVGSVTGGSTL